MPLHQVLTGGLLGTGLMGWTALASMSAATLLAYIIYQCYFSPLAQFPGPLMFKLTRSWYAYHAGFKLWHRELMDLHAKYGPAVRIAPNEISVADPIAHKQIYSAANSQQFVKAPAYSVIKGHRTFDLSTETDVKVHGRQRKLVARAYTMDSIRKLEPAVNEVIGILMAKLKELEGQDIDLGYYLQAYAFDVVGAVSFSRIFGFVANGTDGGQLHRLFVAISSIGFLQHVPWLLKLHNLLMPLTGNLVGLNDRHGHFYDMSDAEVEAWKRRAHEQKDMVATLVDVQNAKPGQLSDQDLKYMMNTNIFAGSDTTSTSLRGTMLNLLRNPSKLERLLQELETRKARGLLSDPVTFEEAEACPYLQAVFWEGVRLYPAIGSPLARVVPKGGMTIDGKFVPAGTIVGSSAYIINRLPEIWGEDANEFRPERWLETDSEKLSQMKSFFFTFGGGSRTCIGRNLSWLEMVKVVPTILLNYDLEWANGDQAYEEYGFLVFIRDLRVRMKKRVQTVPLMHFEGEKEELVSHSYNFTW